MTDFRALCVELVESVEVLLALRPVEARPLQTTEDRLSRARAALADEPAVPEGREPASVTGQPSDEELLETLDKATATFPPRHPEAEGLNAVEYPLALELRKARAVLARWGNPAPQPPAEGEVAELVAALRQEADACFQLKSCGYVEWASRLTRAADLLRRLSPPQPVPVSERLPGPEDCLDEGWAWFFSPRVGWRQAVFPVSTAYTHWLPAHALPIPHQQQENTNG